MVMVMVMAIDHYLQCYRIYNFSSCLTCLALLHLTSCNSRRCLPMSAQHLLVQWLHLPIWNLPKQSSQKQQKYSVHSWRFKVPAQPLSAWQGGCSHLPGAAASYLLGRFLLLHLQALCQTFVGLMWNLAVLPPALQQPEEHCL